MDYVSNNNPTIEGGRITRYYGIVSGETIIGANVFRDFFASIRDVVGGRRALMKKCCAKPKILLCARCKNMPVPWVPMP